MNATVAMLGSSYQYQFAPRLNGRYRTNPYGWSPSMLGATARTVEMSEREFEREVGGKSDSGSTISNLFSQGFSVVNSWLQSRKEEAIAEGKKAEADTAAAAQDALARGDESEARRLATQLFSQQAMVVGGVALGAIALIAVALVLTRKPKR
jgi:hypothetical protein